VGDSQVIAAATKSASKRREIRQIQAKHEPDGDAGLADTLRRRLVKAGATPAADCTSALLQSPAVWVDGSAADTLGGVLTAYLAEQCDALLRGDLGLRLDQPFITVTLSAVRRLQNMLRSFTPVWIAREAGTLDEELEWLAGLLTEVADRQALDKRLVAQLAALPAPLVHGPVAARLDSVLTAEQELHRSVLREAMHSNRYRQLLQRLASWRDAPPLTDRAGKPGAAVKKYLAQTARLLDRRLSATTQVDGDGDGDGGELDTIRILGGQLEHAAEVGARALGPKAAKLVGQRRWSLDLLDEHHRSGLSAAFLLRIGPVDAGGEHSGFTYGLLYEQELRRAASLRKQLAVRQG
jgi:hypothetical protein